MRALLVVAVIVVSLGFAACDRLVDPPLPSDAEQFSPPAVYQTWWDMTRACSGLGGSFSAVTWYKTAQPLHDPNSGVDLVGYWSAGSNRIVLTTAAMLSGGAVRHEMLHALLQKGGHPRNQFLGNCLGTVDCQRACVVDAGPFTPPPESPIQVRDDSIDITMDVEPHNPTTGHDGGFFSVTVLVRNRSTQWASVLPFLPGPDVRYTFSFDVRGPNAGFNSSVVALDSAETVFAPGETKRHVFEFQVGDDTSLEQLQPGAYTVRGGYAGYTSGDSSFVIGP